jgi:uncharacterized protein (TIGR03437 family)
MFRFGLVLFFPLSMVAQTGSLNMSQDLVARGIAASNLTPNTPALDAKPLVEAAVAYAAINAVATVTADTGSYYFPSQRLVLAGAANVTLDFRNADLYFASGATGAVECQNCSAVTLQNFTVDFLQLPFTQVSVTAVDAANRTLTFQVPAGWRAPSELTGDVRMFVFRNGAPLAQVGRLDAAKPVAGSVVQIANADPWAQSSSLATIQPGDTMVMTDRGGVPAINIVGGQKVSVRNVSVYSSGGSGLVFTRTAGMTADRVQVIPRPGTARLIGTNGEGIRVNAALANGNATNNIVRRTGDDGISYSAGWIATVAQTPVGATVQVVRNGSAPFPVGAPVSFISTADASVVGSANITAESPAVSTQTMSGGEMVTLTLDKAVGGLGAGFGVTDNDSQKRGAGSLIALNTVQEVLYGAGLRLAGLQGVMVRDNLVQRTNGAGILLQQPTGVAGPSSAITIRNNLVDNAINYGGVSAGPMEAAAAIHTVAESATRGQVTTRPFSSIFVTNNRVTNAARTGIRLQNVAGGDVTGNVIHGYGLTAGANVWQLPPCCETMAQFVSDFAQPLLSTNSLLTVSGNTAVADSNNAIANVSSASGFPRLAVSSWAVAYGTKLGPNAIATAVPFPTTLGGFSVQVTDSAGTSRFAPMYYTSPTQVAYLVPDGTAPGMAVVTTGSSSGLAQIDSVAPGIYSANSSGAGVAAALAAVYTASGGVNSKPVFQCAATCVAAPLTVGGPSDALIVSLFGSGFRNFSAMRNVTAQVGGVGVTVQYIGAVAGNPGLDQVNLIIPATLAGAGEVPVVLTVDGQTANVVTLAVR